MNKSYVSLETKICPATGYQFSPEVQEQLDKGFVVLVECDPEKSVGNTPDTVWRTGNITYLKKRYCQRDV